MGLLEEIVSRRRDRVRGRKASSPKPPRPSSPPRSFGEAVRRRGKLQLVAEIKRASPSGGLLRKDLAPGELARSYEQAGASAISVLTEEDYFRGSLEDLGLARDACSRPVLAKDFVVDEYQISESRDWGADAVLLIVRILEEEKLRDFIAAATALGMDALVEVHNEVELDVALKVGARLVGLNNRDLDTMRVDTGRALGLLENLPRGITVVVESGIKTRRDVERIEATRADAILVGEVLMRSRDPGAKVRELLGQ